MPAYYVNKQEQSNGDHEVHRPICAYFPSMADAEYLGDYSNCYSAVVVARTYYSQVNGCKFCCLPCHTQ